MHDVLLILITCNAIEPAIGTIKQCSFASVCCHVAHIQNDVLACFFTCRDVI